MSKEIETVIFSREDIDDETLSVLDEFFEEVRQQQLDERDLQTAYKKRRGELNA